MRARYSSTINKMGSPEDSCAAADCHWFREDPARSRECPIPEPRKARLGRTAQQVAGVKAAKFNSLI